ncbi:MAG: phage tail protein I [Candidatus Gastranaerophilales bacterium]|nr:phage tail protein I [Candidatus Gastranaerophilales bacterium]
MMGSLIPVVLQDQSNLAVEKCAAKAFEMDLKPLMIYAFDHVDLKFLPLLAEAFHILGDEGWNFAESEQEKRNLLKNALEIHRYKGTKYALLKVLETLNIQGDIKEWFEYEGNPYYFKVILNVFSRGLSETVEQQLIKLINTFKNARSRLEAIEVYLTSICKQNIFAYTKIGEIITINAKEE